MPIHNEDIAMRFDEMADLLALRGANPFRIRAYRRASQVIRSLPDELYKKQRPCYFELNAQPARLDLDDVLVRGAAAAGNLISIASNSHKITDFDLLSGGVVQARRGWLTSSQVLNTKPLGELRALLRSTFL